MSAKSTQVGGDHYSRLKIQPVEFIHANGIGFLEGNAIKYLVRHRAKGGRQDLEKAKHYIDLLLEAEYSNAKKLNETIGANLIEFDRKEGTVTLRLDNVPESIRSGPWALVNMIEEEKGKK